MITAIGNLTFLLILFQILIFSNKFEQHVIKIFDKYHFVQFSSKQFGKNVNIPIKKLFICIEFLFLEQRFYKLQ